MSDSAEITRQAKSNLAIALQILPKERRDGMVTFYAYCRVVDDLADDPRFIDVAARRIHFDELLAIVRDWAASVADVDQLEARLAEHGLAMGVIRSVREVCATDWAAEREVIVDVDDRGGGTVRIPNAPWRFASADVGVRGHPRYRGEDNHAVFAELLGLSSEQLQHLDESGVFVSRNPS